MKYMLTAVLLVLIAGFAAADVGPSPSFSFSLSNASEFSGYDFYYKGNIMGPYEVTDETSVYKLDTLITIYAVPEGEAFSEDAISFGPIEIKAGNTVYEISLNAQAGTLTLQEQSHAPDAMEEGFFGLGLITLVLLVVVAAVLAALMWFVMRKRHKK